jgi:putative restriction endonuclease
MKAVFTHKVGSIYDDLPEERYHFPRTYLAPVEATVGDLIVYYEPGRTGLGDRGRTGRRAYVATALVKSVIEDPNRADHHYALIEPGSYVEFDRPVPFRKGGRFFEEQLRREDGQTSKGAFGRAVRPLEEAEYENILRAGFAQELPLAEPQLRGDAPSLTVAPGLMEAPESFERPIVERLLSRPVRDAAFARAVQTAYAATCAMTGLKIINGGGRAEVQAAHIRPVKDQGPDSVRNGVALSGTVHWMFDRGLVSIGPPPHFEILTSNQNLPASVLRLFNLDRRLRLPRDQRFWPAPSYLEYHRHQIFKG